MRLLGWLLIGAGLVGAAGPAKQPVGELGLPPFGPPGAFRVPAITEVKLDNGLRVYLAPDAASPAVRVAAYVRAGSVFDPPEKLGLSAMTAQLLRTLPDNEADPLEAISGSIAAEALDATLSVAVSAASRSSGQALSLLAGLLRDRKFDEDAFDRVRGELRIRISRRNLDTDGLAVRELRRALAGSQTVMARQMEYEHIDNIGVQDVAQFHRAYFTAANMIVVVSGSFDPEAIRPEIGKLFGGLPTGEAKAFPAAMEKPAPGFYVADQPEAKQASIVIGIPMEKAAAARDAAVAVGLDILAGGSNSRLQTLFKANSQWDARAAAESQPGSLYQGLAVILVRCEPSYVTDVLLGVLKEVEKMGAAGASDAEVSLGAARFVNGLALRYERPEMLAEQVLVDEFTGSGRDVLSGWQKGALGVQAAAVREAFQERWKPEKLAIVVAGSTTLFNRPVSELGRPAIPLDVRIPGPRLTPPPATAESIAAGRERLKKLQAALGGVERLRGVKDYRSLQRGRVWIGGGSTTIEEVNRWIAPRTFRQDQSFPHGKSSIFYNGEIGWIRTAQGLSSMSPVTVRQSEDEIFHLPFLLAVSDQAKDRTVSAVGTNILDIYDGSGHGARVYLADTGLPERVTYHTMQPGNVFVMVEETYSDWREYDGLKMPGKTVVKHDGRKFCELATEHVSFNSKLDLQEMERKQ